MVLIKTFPSKLLFAYVKRIINESNPNFIHNPRNIILSMQKNLDMYYPLMNHILRQIPKNE
jgi:hypothetical protein